MNKEIVLDDVVKAVSILCDSACKNEALFSELDGVCGDGDFGFSLAKGFRLVKENLSTCSKNAIGDFLMDCSKIITKNCGGSTGPIWGSAFMYMARAAGDKTVLKTEDLHLVLRQAADGIQKVGGAQAGDKTLLDALIPAVDALEECSKNGLEIREAFFKCAEAATAGAEQTKQMIARKGRASYLGERSLGSPDAGAYAVGVLLSDISSGCRPDKKGE